MGQKKVRYMVGRGPQVDEEGRYLQVGDRKYRNGETIPTSELAGALNLNRLLKMGAVRMIEGES